MTENVKKVRGKVVFWSLRAVSLIVVKEWGFEKHRQDLSFQQDSWMWKDLGAQLSQDNNT